MMPRISEKLAVWGGLIFLIAVVLISCKENTVQPETFGSIEGKVIDAETEDPIENASVITAPATTSIVTNSEGNFTFSDIKTGSYTITVEKVGYQKKSVTVSVKEDQITSVTIQLQKGFPSEGPGKAKNPFPGDQATDQLRIINLSWQPPDSNYTVKYDVYFYDSEISEPKTLALDVEDTTVAAPDLNYAQTYFWRVDSKYNDTLITQGDVWTFTVRDLPDYRFFWSSKRNGNYDVFNSDSIAGDVIQLTNLPSKEWWPRLSPNRRYIAFSSDEEGEFNIYRMDRNGDNRYKVTTLPIAGYNNNGIGFSWSPDGGKFLYSHYSNLYTIDDNGANLTLIATAPTGRNFRECEYSPLTNKIVVLTQGEKPYDNEIYTMDPDGSNMTLFVDNVPGTIASPSWSIDGARIIFTRDVSGIDDPTGRQYDTRVIIKGIVDTTSVDISTSKSAGTNDTNPRFSPDGAYVIFENTTNDGFNPKDIWIMTQEGDDRNLIIENAETPDYK